MFSYYVSNGTVTIQKTGNFKKPFINNKYKWLRKTFSVCWLEVRFSCGSFGPLTSGPSDLQPVLKNFQSVFYIVLKMTP